MVQITYLGNATFGISSETTSILIDPFITENTECPFSIDEAIELIDNNRVDAICVTHMGYDHIGDTLTLATEYDIPVITEPAVMHYLQQNGVRKEQITKVTSGMKVLVGDVMVRAIEAKHISTTVIGDQLVTGEPLGFLVDDGESSVYHLGDTSIFTDLQLFGDLYQPDVALLGVGQAHSEANDPGPVTRILHELTTEEAVTVARWVGSDRVVPMHYLPEEREAFIEAMDERDDVPDVVPLDAGEQLAVE